MASSNPFRFSTKYQDEETEMVYYGHRYYNSKTGRWLSRDPIEESGGVNVYSFVNNNPISQFDILGLWWASGHTDQTRGAWTTVDMPAHFKGKMADMLVAENVQVDSVYASVNYWHFDRGLTESVDSGVSGYLNTLCDQNTAMWALLNNPNRGNCEGSFKIMGKLSHAYQDYYAHGIDMQSDGSALTIGYISGTPDSPGVAIKPASWLNIYNWGEHLPTEPGWRGPDYASRTAQGQAYTAAAFQSFAPTWWSKCKCYAGQIFP